MKYAVRDIIGENALTLEDGQSVYDRIKTELVNGRPVELDFADVRVFASPFFNAAVGQLLKDFKPEDLNRLLSVSNLIPAGHDVLTRVIENAKQYYSSEDFRKAQSEVLRAMSEAE